MLDNCSQQGLVTMMEGKKIFFFFFDTRAMIYSSSELKLQREIWHTFFTKITHKFL